jgi:hypothetical protein
MGYHFQSAVHEHVTRVWCGRHFLPCLPHREWICMLLLKKIVFDGKYTVHFYVVWTKLFLEPTLIKSYIQCSSDANVLWNYITFGSQWVWY